MAPEKDVFIEHNENGCILYVKTFIKRRLFVIGEFQISIEDKQQTSLHFSCFSSQRNDVFKFVQQFAIKAPDTLFLVQSPLRGSLQIFFLGGRVLKYMGYVAKPSAWYIYTSFVLREYFFFQHLCISELIKKAVPVFMATISLFHMLFLMFSWCQISSLPGDLEKRAL